MSCRSEWLLSKSLQTEGGGRGRSGWGTRVHPWWIHVDVWQNQ